MDWGYLFTIIRDVIYFNQFGCRGRKTEPKNITSLTQKKGNIALFFLFVDLVQKIKAMCSDRKQRQSAQVSIYQRQT